MVISKQQEQSKKILYLISSSKIYGSYEKLNYNYSVESLEFIFSDYKNKKQFLHIGISKNLFYSGYMFCYTLYYKIIKDLINEYDNKTSFTDILLFCKKVLKFNK